MRLSASKTTRVDFLPSGLLVELDTEEGEELVHAVTPLTIANSKQIIALFFMYSPSPETSQNTTQRQLGLVSPMY